MPISFESSYTFRDCMVKVAALAVAALEWCDTEEGREHPELGIPDDVCADVNDCGCGDCDYCRMFED